MKVIDWLSGILMQSGDEGNIDEGYWDEEGSDGEEGAPVTSWILSMSAVTGVLKPRAVTVTKLT
jgi:hypothetical protein